MTTDVRIAAAGTAQHRAGAEVLAAAFDADPVYARLVPDPHRRARALRALFRLAVRDAARVGAVDLAAAGGRALGAAVWLAPGRFPLSAGRKLRAIPGMLALLRGAPGSFAGLARLGAGIEAAHPAELSWYLQAVGVHPAAQGRGIGGRLLSHGLARADAGATASTLETAVPAAAALYERFGFRIQGEVHLVDDGPVHQLMRRPPHGRLPGQAPGMPVESHTSSSEGRAR